MLDGGFLVSGTSTANSEDRSAPWLSRSDPEYDAIDGDSACVTASGSRFLDAESTVVLRLNADGSLRWIRRLTDGAFDAAPLRTKGEGLQPLVPATADGVIVARSVGNAALVHRLRADGSVRWRRAIAGFNAEDDRSTAPPLADIVQTDDPVDGADGDLRDGQRDDGFLLASRTRVVKLDAEGALHWNTGVELEGCLAPNHHFSVHGLAQHCDYGRPTRCDAVVVGSAFDRDLPRLVHAERLHRLPRPRCRRRAAGRGGAADRPGDRVAHRDPACASPAPRPAPGDCDCSASRGAAWR